MKRVRVLALLGTFALSFPALSQTSTASTKKASTKTVAGKTHKAARHTRSRRAPAPTYQLHPDPERYQQIQQALADRGYFKGQVNGNWGDDSIDAVKRFQVDQKIEPDGKINALTLIDLGLGPKHEAAVAPPPASPHPAAASSPSAPAAMPANGDPPK